MMLLVDRLIDLLLLFALPLPFRLLMVVPEFTNAFRSVLERKKIGRTCNQSRKTATFSHNLRSCLLLPEEG